MIDLNCVFVEWAWNLIVFFLHGEKLFYLIKLMIFLKIQLYLLGSLNEFFSVYFFFLILKLLNYLVFLELYNNIKVRVEKLLIYI